jgi:hypothetical protein
MKVRRVLNKFCYQTKLAIHYHEHGMFALPNQSTTGPRPEGSAISRPEHLPEAATAGLGHFLVDTAFFSNKRIVSGSTLPSASVENGQAEA